MDRAEATGLGIAVVGHALLFAALSVGLLASPKPKPPVTDPIDVQLVDLIGLRSAAPASADEAAPSEAPEKGPSEEAPPPPEPIPAPPLPAAAPPQPAPPPPKPAPPKPVPPKPAPPKPVPPKPVPPKPEPKPAPPKPVPPKETPRPKPAPPKPAPKPTPKPAPKPKPAEPTEKQAAAAKAAAAKAASDRAAAAKAASDKAAADAAAKAAAAKAAAAKAAAAKAAAAKAAAAKAAGEGKGEKARGSRLGPDFLKGITPEKSEGKAPAPKAAVVSARAMSGLVSLIAAQVKPCYNPPAGGAGASQIVTILSIRMKPDGSVASVTAGSQTGVEGSNGAYAKQMADAARRAVLRCSPLKLPADLYEGGWDDFDFRFRPEQMQ